MVWRGAATLGPGRSGGAPRYSRERPRTQSFCPHRVPQGAFRLAARGRAEQAPTRKAWAPKEGDTGGRPRPKADADRGLPPKVSRQRWPSANGPQTSPRPSGNRSGFGGPRRPEHAPQKEGVQRTTGCHRASGHRPGRSVSRRGTRHRKAPANKGKAPNGATIQRDHGTGKRVIAPDAPPKGAPLQWLGKSPSETASDAADPGATREGGRPAGQGPVFASRGAKAPDERAET
jgi:hypothetical protein